MKRGSDLLNIFGLVFLNVEDMDMVWDIVVWENILVREEKLAKPSKHNEYKRNGRGLRQGLVTPYRGRHLTRI